MKLNNKDRRILRKNIEEKLNEMPMDSEKVKLNKDVLEQLIFDEMTADLKDGITSFKYPVWTGEQLRKLDLSEVSFDNVFWGADNAFYSIIKGKEFFESKLTKEGTIIDENKYLIDFSGTNVNVDFSQSLDYKITNKNCDSQLQLYFVNFADVDLSNSNMDLFDSVFFQKVNLSNTKAIINIDDASEIYYSNLDNTNLKDSVLSSIENLETSTYRNSGLRIFGRKELAKMIKNHSLDGCMVNGVKILSEEEKKIKRQEQLEEYKNYKTKLQEEINDSIKKVQ